MNPQQPAPGAPHIPPPTNLAYTPKKPIGLIITVVLLVLLLIGSLAFGGWAYSGKQSAETDLDAQIAAANEVAVAAALAEAEVNFAEEQKTPFKSYQGSAVLGSFTFDYPKTWSAYVAESGSSQPLDFYAFPDAVPEIAQGTVYALRAIVTSRSYDQVLATYASSINSGAVRSSAYRPTNVPSVLGTRLDGAVIRDKTGAMLILPQRDKTIQIWTESPQFLADFETIITSISFAP